MTLRLTSSAFRSGDKIPQRFTCEGANVSPPLSWSGAPEAARSFALFCSDPDAPGGTFYHWAIFDIPRTTTELAEHHRPAAALPHEAMNDFGKKGHGGPCPPHGHGDHHYHFRLFALDTESLPAGPRASCRDIERASKEHAVAEAELVGTFAR
ncbi:MAG TPA: YbhB/YbcL family Raf kinase inhibitor-like protein [Stellaceae bacterium]|nr:YbhB/YbcL family Raf kinase inhibitor-like protein [Stellaceae bacterium]